MRLNEAVELVEALNAQNVGVKFKTDKANKGVSGWTVKAIKMVERTNLMSGKTFMEDEDTPYYLSPSSETYWSR